jgi:hypothetical protein
VSDVIDTDEWPRILDTIAMSVPDAGLAGRGTVELHPKAVEIEPASAPTVVGISDCVNSAHSHLYKVDGHRCIA